MEQHLLFFDGECGFCNQIVQFVLRKDKKKCFLFAPLQGITAKKKLSSLPDEQKQIDSLVFIENLEGVDEKIYLQGKGALRVVWHLSLPWKLIGVLSFFPSFLFDGIYSLIARYRHQIGKKGCFIRTSEEKKRFLS